MVASEEIHRAFSSLARRPDAVRRIQLFTMIACRIFDKTCPAVSRTNTPRRRSAATAQQRIDAR
jgi:hypothetical protein